LTGIEILRDFARLSEPFGTTIEIDGEHGNVVLG